MRGIKISTKPEGTRNSAVKNEMRSKLMEMELPAHESFIAEETCIYKARESSTMRKLALGIGFGGFGLYAYVSIALESDIMLEPAWQTCYSTGLRQMNRPTNLG